jgi:hypothetical protein
MLWSDSDSPLGQRWLVGQRLIDAVGVYCGRETCAPSLRRTWLTRVVTLSPDEREDIGSASVSLLTIQQTRDEQWQDHVDIIGHLAVRLLRRRPTFLPRANALGVLVPCCTRSRVGWVLHWGLGSDFLRRRCIMEIAPHANVNVAKANRLGTPRRRPWVRPDPARAVVLIGSHHNYRDELIAKLVKVYWRAALSIASDAGADAKPLTRKSLTAALAGVRNGRLLAGGVQLQVVAHWDAARAGRIRLDDGYISLPALRAIISRPNLQSVDLAICKSLERVAPLFSAAGVRATSGFALTLNAERLAERLKYFWTLMMTPAPRWVLSYEHVWRRIEEIHWGKTRQVDAEVDWESVYEAPRVSRDALPCG